MSKTQKKQLKKICKLIKKVEYELIAIRNLNSSKEIKQIGFQQLYNLQSKNEFDDE